MRVALAYTSYIVVAVAWTLAYIAIIHRSWRDQTYGMPILAMAANISWEGLFAFVFPTPPVLWYRNLLWFTLDVIIAAQCLRYARQEFTHPELKARPQLVVFGTLALTCAVVWAFIWEFQDLRGWYSGFAMNLLMSVLFVAMLLNRNDIRGQSLYVGLLKWLGTLGAITAVIVASPPNVLTAFTGVLPEYWTPPSTLMLVMYAIIFIFDWIYIVAVYHMCRRDGINPWMRW